MLHEVIHDLFTVKTDINLENVFMAIGFKIRSAKILHPFRQCPETGILLHHLFRALHFLFILEADIGRHDRIGTCLFLCLYQCLLDNVMRNRARFQNLIMVINACAIAENHTVIRYTFNTAQRIEMAAGSDKARMTVLSCPRNGFYGTWY